MKIFKLKYQVYDIFLDQDNSYTGFEPSCWIRLGYNKQNKWQQYGGIKLQGYKFNMLTKNLETTLRIMGEL